MAKTFMEGIGVFSRLRTVVIWADTIIKQVYCKEYHIQTTGLGLGVRQIRMVSLHVVLPRMKYQRLALSPAVVNHFTEEDHVVASLEFANHAADKVSCGSFQERATFDVVAAVDIGEPV